MGNKKNGVHAGWCCTARNRTHSLTLLSARNPTKLPPGVLDPVHLLLLT